MDENNADYGLTIQKLICDMYHLKINGYANNEFLANYNANYESELRKVIKSIFERIEDEPAKLLTYTNEFTTEKQTVSPHNFLLKSGKTISIRTTKTSDKVAPRVVGQAGYAILNDYFSDVLGRKISNQNDIKELVYTKIDEILPVFIDNLFQSDYTVLINRKDLENFQIISIDEVGKYSFNRNDFTFTKELNEWKESITLKYKGVSIAAIQTHLNRTFKFRFIISKIPEWFTIVKETNETLGISAEATICNVFKLKKPNSFKTRSLPKYEKELTPIIKEAFGNIPKPIMHTGSMTGIRGKNSKCNSDFKLENDKTLSVKTNKGKMVCPPEVGQPCGETFLKYFGHLLGGYNNKIDANIFKKLVISKADLMLPIYLDHLFDSNYLLWIYEKNNTFKHIEINCTEQKKIKWDKSKITFTKDINNWNESNTIKYDGLSIGEFQVHTHRNCYKFRFNMPNLLALLSI